MDQRVVTEECWNELCSIYLSRNVKQKKPSTHYNRNMNQTTKDAILVDGGIIVPKGTDVVFYRAPERFSIGSHDCCTLFDYENGRIITIKQNGRYRLTRVSRPFGVPPAALMRASYVN